MKSNFFSACLLALLFSAPFWCVACAILAAVVR